ncbi:isochorismatase family protein [Adlercreutzia sp. R25]|uniref:cysteine hydrolase family protein n=1 Tax=Adlercreutzia shanghongiae TaxID=3111773 RepID=UPI002DBB8F09|nr:isochorismatase family protein [Adlercreutzia sp. R25]MEC4273698.1 isochorismatase family protein [Adlercreutzia sp. R25]
MESAANGRVCSRRAFVGMVATGAAALWASGAVGSPAGSKAYGDERAASSILPVAGSGVSGNARSGRRAVAPYAMPAMAGTAELEASLRRVLVVVDYQVDFVDGGVFGRIEPAVAVEEALYEKIRAHQEAGDIVIYTMDTHPSDNYADTREGQVNEPHCIPGTPGWEVYGRVGELLTPERALMVMKGTYGSRDLPTIIEAIRRQGVSLESIEFAGVSTTCRVLHNAIIVFNAFPELPMIFDDSTTASYEDARTVGQLDELESWGFVVRRTNERLRGVKGART